MAWRGATLRVPHSTSVIVVLYNSSATFAKIYLTQISNASGFRPTPSAIITYNETRFLHINALPSTSLKQCQSCIYMYNVFRRKVIILIYVVRTLYRQKLAPDDLHTFISYGLLQLKKRQMYTRGLEL